MTRYSIFDLNLVIESQREQLKYFIVRKTRAFGVLWSFRISVGRQKKNLNSFLYCVTSIKDQDESWRTFIVDIQQ